ncbi:uncharacterized protein EV422DRAFT_515823 [Fimicolochytrium jonesii]|uniref:uncharacterized protein n=1 Tax=Fimicolochytrium jonesii TaxID=1396493 RepID=UPI0022FF23A5|nr:uncharacterized protein EV422DRAFT_515823 [Fimicolochytrium jonesii]KAI8826223.1 hypothetical protein EV422DRAFT_515823 [Fimicolochytrium jonesii]
MGKTSCYSSLTLLEAFTPTERMNVSDLQPPVVPPPSGATLDSDLHSDLHSDVDRPFRVLILGDGNFSFSLALCRLLFPKPVAHSAISHSHSKPHSDVHSLPYNRIPLALLGLLPSSTAATTPQPRRRILITSTSFDDRTELLGKYPESREILESLQGDWLRNVCGVEVRHGVNAWELSKAFENQLAEAEGFDCVIWNHPHLGTEDFRLHRFLMAHFFDSVASVLRRHPLASVCVSLVDGQETRWDVVAQAARSELRLNQVAMFDERLWPGYVVKRNKHGGSFKNGLTRRNHHSEMKSRLFRFGWGEGKVVWKGMEETSVDALLVPGLDDGLEAPTETSQTNGTTTGPHPKPPKPTLDITPSSPASTTPTSRHTAKQRRLALIPASLTCPHCLKQLDTARGYTQHVHMVHTLQKFGADWSPDKDAAKKYKCEKDGCERLFATGDARRQHWVNRHTTVGREELPVQVGNLEPNPRPSQMLPHPPADDAVTADTIDTTPAADYDYTPCPICGQAVVRRSWGMQLHLETLKPAVGLNMQCPLCVADGNGKGSGKVRGFIESRALFQHYKFCREARKVRVEGGEGEPAV